MSIFIKDVPRLKFEMWRKGGTQHLKCILYEKFPEPSSSSTISLKELSNGDRSNKCLIEIEGRRVVYV